MNARLVSPAAVIMVALAGAAMAEEDVRKVQLPPPETAVIEEKCLVCHNRKRIDEAVSRRKDMEEVLIRMEQKGVVLTEQEHQVLGVFGTQKPFKGK